MLQLDLEGMRFEFRIEKYRPSTRENWDYEWCKVYARACTNEPDINYETYSECMLCSEVEWLYSKLGELIKGSLNEDMEISFIEPDFEYCLHPRENNAYDMDWRFNLWNDGILTCNSIITYWCEDDIKKLYGYLKSVLAESTT